MHVTYICSQIANIFYKHLNGVIISVFARSVVDPRSGQFTDYKKNCHLLLLDDACSIDDKEQTLISL